MTTYNTYAEAKIANPDSTIYVHGSEFATQEYVEKFIDWKNWIKWSECHPKDYCMSVADFTDSGYKYVDGDSYLGADGEVYTVGVDFSSVFANLKRNYSGTNRYMGFLETRNRVPAEPKRQDYVS